MQRQLLNLLADKKLRFVAAGLLNTGVDFALFNTAIIVLGLQPWLANVGSTSVAMALSFIINKYLVFRDKRTMSSAQFVAFVGVTAAGLWGLQTGIILLLSPLFGQLGHQVTGHHQPVLLITWLAANVAKVLATVASAVWNYIWYDGVIFADRKSRFMKVPKWL